MKPHRPSFTSSALALVFSTLVFAPGLATAAFKVVEPHGYTGDFEGSDYAPGQRLSRITDATANQTWELKSTNGNMGEGVDAVVSAENPAGQKGKHIRLTDASGSANISARLNLSPVVPVTQTFLFQFKVATAKAEGGGTRQVGLGQAEFFNSAKMWANVILSDTRTLVVVAKKVDGSDGAFSARKADGTSFVENKPGQYATLRFVIDPNTRRYKSIRVNDVEQLGLGPIGSELYVPGNPADSPAYFKVFSGTSTTGIIDIDDLVIAPAENEP